MRLRLKKFLLLSDFKTKFSQRVKFQINFFTTCQVLNQNFYNVSDFVLKHFFKNQVLQKNVQSKDHVFTEFTP